MCWVVFTKAEIWKLKTSSPKNHQILLTFHTNSVHMISGKYIHPFRINLKWVYLFLHEELFINIVLKFDHPAD